MVKRDGQKGSDRSRWQLDHIAVKIIEMATKDLEYYRN